jgi:hypothetical protein
MNSSPREGKCRKKLKSKSWNELTKTSGKANRPARRPVNLFARRWTTFARESTARDRPSRPSRLGSPKRAARASSCLRPRLARHRRRCGAKPNVTPNVASTRANRHRPGRGLPLERCAARDIQQLRMGLWRVRRTPQPSGAGHSRGTNPRSAPSVRKDRPG